MKRRVALAMALLFAGMFAVVLDLRLHGFDLVNDVAGMGAITVGLFVVYSVRNPRAQLPIAGAALLSVLATSLTLLVEVEGGAPDAVTAFVALLVTVAGVLLLVDGMTVLAEAAHADELAASWRRTRRIAWWGYGAAVLLRAAPVARPVPDGVDTIHTAVVIAALAVPSVHLAVSMWRTARAARAPDPRRPSPEMRATTAR